MKIAKFQADQENMIHIQNCVRLLTMGLQNNKVTLWAIVDPITKQGLPLISFSVKADEEKVSAADAKLYVTSFINDKIILHLFSQEPKILPAMARPINRDYGDKPI